MATPVPDSQHTQTNKHTYGIDKTTFFMVPSSLAMTTFSFDIDDAIQNNQHMGVKVSQSILCLGLSRHDFNTICQKKYYDFIVNPNQSNN